MDAYLVWNNISIFYQCSLQILIFYLLISNIALVDLGIIEKCVLYYMLGMFYNIVFYVTIVGVQPLVK